MAAVRIDNLRLSRRKVSPAQAFGFTVRRQFGRIGSDEP
jgi:hypothetical protein